MGAPAATSSPGSTRRDATIPAMGAVMVVSARSCSRIAVWASTVATLARAPAISSGLAPALVRSTVDFAADSRSAAA